jgi:hypothetical protein
VTPREQLIEAMTTRLIPRVSVYANPLPEALPLTAYDVKDLAAETLQALSDLGAVVLMPVSSSDVHSGERYYTTEEHIVEGYSATEQVGRGWKVAGNPMMGAVTVYIDALGEQS